METIKNIWFHRIYLAFVYIFLGLVTLAEESRYNKYYGITTAKGEYVYVFAAWPFYTLKQYWREE